MDNRETKLISALDYAGVAASSICLVHCLAMPFVIALLPVVAASLMESDWFHVVLAFTILVFCLMAFIPGYMRHHDRRLIFIGISGVGLVFFATFVARFLWGENVEIAIVTAGNIVLVAGHLLNRRLLHSACCASNHGHDSVDVVKITPPRKVD